ncbi:DNA-invertase hin [Methylobacterium haplocladii]|uniref:recombinase family protein n=1 Tax=Methylobacterium haplocladii TaxID=1176176 RepID=UPI001EE0837E|nr:recombinase family protein [Methylobacterium haplocladii]GJD82347.1 DNA-invertase hin [Methylobacterium haplocladii]
MLVGYARVSTLDQNLDLQRDALLKVGCDRVFEEKRSGKVGTKRPEFEAVLSFLRPDDVLVVWKLDRLGRSLVEMMRTIDALRRQDVHFRSLTEQFDSGTAHGRFALQMHGAMAEYFLDLNRERTMEGLKAALARGRKGGRPKKLKEGDLIAGQAMLNAGTVTVAEVARRLGVSRQALYEHMPQARARSSQITPSALSASHQPSMRS